MNDPFVREPRWTFGASDENGAVEELCRTTADEDWSADTEAAVHSVLHSRVT